MAGMSGLALEQRSRNRDVPAPERHGAALGANPGGDHVAERSPVAGASLIQHTTAGEVALNAPATSDPAVASLRSEPRTLLAAIVQLASNPAVDVQKLDALLNMQERMEVRQAEIEFNQALARLSQKMPRVNKNGTVTLKTKEGKDSGSYQFAKWQDIDRIIRPLMAEEGFSLSFDSQQRQGEGGGIIVTGTLLHRDGHSKSASMPLALDAGPGRNNLQAMGSSLSYGKRYCAEMLLNIVREAVDDDGVTGGAPKSITEEQRDALNILADHAGANKRKFCEMFGIDSIADLPATMYAAAERMLKERLAVAQKATNNG